MDGKWEISKISEGTGQKVFASGQRRNSTSTTYKLTAPDGTRFHCNRSDAGYTAVSVDGDGMDYLTFSPDGVCRHIGKDLAGKDEKIQLLLSTGPHLHLAPKPEEDR